MRLGCMSATGRVMVLMPALALGAIELAPPAATQPSVEQCAVFDRAFPGPATGNPFVDIELSARFTSGNQTVTAGGFYGGRANDAARRESRP
jgi:hypothetical protein